MEARSGSNPNRVRMFTSEKLSKPEAEQKWDSVKVVCRQPFNKHVQYGLAFITFHSVIAEDKPASLSNKLGRFLVKDDNDELNSVSAGSLFARRKDIETQPLRGKVLQLGGYVAQSGPTVYYVALLLLHSAALKDLVVCPFRCMTVPNLQY
jgi:hypothetical protein